MMTRAEFARYMGVDRSQTTRWVSMGMPTNPDGSISPERARTWVKKNIDPTRRALAHRGTTGGRRQPEPTEEIEPVSQAMTIFGIWLAARMPAAAAARALADGMDRDAAAWVYQLVARAAEEQLITLLQNFDLPCRTADSWSTWRHPGFEPMPEAAAA